MNQDNSNTIYMQKEQDIGSSAKGRLIIIDGTSFEEIDLMSFGKDRLFIGRDPAKNDIVLRSPIVSSVHGKIKIQEGRIYFADMNSSNGTYQKRELTFEKMAPMKYYPLETADNIFRIDMPGDRQRNTVVLFFCTHLASGTWKQYEMQTDRIGIGRAEDNQIVLNQASVSRYHAVLQRSGNDMSIMDNHSVNGVFINGMHLEGSCQLHDKDMIQIAGITIFVVGNTLVYKARGSGINLQVHDLCKVVGSGSSKHLILDHVDCRIENNEFVAIIGGSGAGKTTLMTAMSGFDPKVEGQVFCNGIDLHANFDTLKNIIGFVPQQDIIYENLTLKKMLYYTARMKMPEDTSNAEMWQRIDKVLEMVELTEHKEKYIRKLSGGQKKRASIAVELLADPGLFFLDEPTSGLDPGTEQKLMQTLSKLSKREEKTIVMVTHTTQSLHLCDKIIIMGNGGRLCFCGTPAQAKQFFHTDDLVDIYNFVTDNSLEWSRQFKNAVEQEEQHKPPVPGKKIHVRRTSAVRQLSVLVARYAELMWNDKQRLLLLLIQPFLVAVLLNVVSGKKVFIQYEDTKSILFAMACAGIWIGLFNTIQEICKERVILKREYMANLRLSVYILSKYVVQMIICLIQAIILTGAFLGLTENDLREGVLFHNAAMDILITMFITILASASIGLIISALVTNGDRAMAVAPFILIIQLLFSGILFELNGIANQISKLTISRWAVGSLGNIAQLNKLDKLADITLMKELKKMAAKIGEDPEKPKRVKEAIFYHGWDHLNANWIIMLAMTLVCAVISALVLRKLKDEQR